jgi:outer membrane protein assembly factor BamB
VAAGLAAGTSLGVGFMRTATRLPALFNGNRAVSRAVALAAGAGCVVVMAVSGGAVASASSAASATATKSAQLASRASAAVTPQVAGVPDTSWPAYLDGPLHHSYAPLQTAITPANASTLAEKWSQPIGAPYLSSPIVNRGSVYIGGGNGWFYRLSESTGKVLASIDIGAQPATTCPQPLGVTSTATIMQNPSTHVLTVYVAGGDGYLYALRALTLRPEWRSVIAIPRRHVDNYYDWSSPTVANGKIYIGISSNCDVPLVRAGVVAYNQATGAKLAQFYTVPPGSRGGSVWSSVAVAPSGYVFATTGNGPFHHGLLADSESILKLNPNTLALVARFQVPAAQISGDGDFGASPVIFGRFVGACNKNGKFYALRQRNMTLAWTQQIGNSAIPTPPGECIATPVDNGKDLYFGGNQITNGTVTYQGSVQARSFGGALQWETPLPGGVMGSPTMDGAGVLAVGTYAPGTTGVFLVNAANGALLTPSPVVTGAAFSQPVFAENELFLADSTSLYAFGLP